MTPGPLLRPYDEAAESTAVLKSCLQLLVVLLLALRLRSLCRCVLRSLHDRGSDRLAADFRRELRRRGLFMASPLRSTD